MLLDDAGMRSHGVAEASNMSMAGRPGEWYLNRVKANKPGNGYGSNLLQVLQATLAARKDFTFLIVEPGGYGSDVNRLIKFYESKGFKRTNDYWRWTG
jgi:hypothetical protein